MAPTHHKKPPVHNAAFKVTMISTVCLKGEIMFREEMCDRKLKIKKEDPYTQDHLRRVIDRLLIHNLHDLRRKTLVIDHDNALGSGPCSCRLFRMQDQFTDKTAALLRTCKQQWIANST